MAANVFGLPITDATLQAMPEYIGKPITATDRAHVALDRRHWENKHVNARQFVENLKKRYGNGVSTLCLIYNATGGTLTFAGHHNWNGRIGESPFPNRLQNGQWGAFLHVKTSGAARGSTAAVVYRGENANGTGRDWMLAWYNPWNRIRDDNRVYTEIRAARHYVTDRWNYIYSILRTKGLFHSDTWGGCESHVITGSATSPIFEGVMTLVGA